MKCPFCDPENEQRVWQDSLCRVIRADEPDYPGFMRVVWNEHIAEMSDLSGAEQRHLMNIVVNVEKALRQTLHPDKINLASLGNRVPHLHWHVIPRFADDVTFPESVWGKPQRRGAFRPFPDDETLSHIIETLNSLSDG